MKRLFIISCADRELVHTAQAKLEKLKKRFEKKSFEVNYVIYAAGLDETLPNIVNLKKTQQSISRALIHGFYNPWPADFYSLINFNQQPKEIELARILEAVSSKFSNCAFGSNLIGKSYSSHNFLETFASMVHQIIYPGLKFIDSQSSMVVLDQAAVLAVRNQIKPVSNQLAILDLLTKVHHFGLYASPVPVTVGQSHSANTKLLFNNLNHSFSTRKWKPSKPNHNLSHTHLNHLLTD